MTPDWLVAAFWLLALVFALTLVQMFRLIRMLTDVRDAEHAKCTAHVAYFVGNAFAARVLEAAAEDYDTVEGKAQLQTLSYTNRPEGESLPATWLLNRAATMTPTPGKAAVQ